MASDLEHQQLVKEKKKPPKVNKKPSTKGVKLLQEGRETFTSLSYPKGSIEREEENPLKK